MKKTLITPILALTIILLALQPVLAGNLSGQQAREIMKSSGIRGGLVVFIGSADGKVAEALRPNESYLVHCLDQDLVSVNATRNQIQSLKLYGKISVDLLITPHLPYIDNLINLIVSDGSIEIRREEIRRVLAPEGKAFIRTSGKWTEIHKPRPDAIDEWTHFLHDASNNAVANDTVVAPPRHMQWQSSPEWDRNHHKLASISSVVSAKGRLFYIVDEATSGSMLVPGRWSIAARDAFNGVLLWQKPIDSWVWQGHGFRAGPVQLPRLLVTSGDALFAPLGLSAPVSKLDAPTGKVLTTYTETTGAEEIILHDNVLLVLAGAPTAEQAAVNPGQNRKSFKNEKSLVAIDITKDQVLWTWHETPPAFVMPVTLTAAKQNVFLQTGPYILCLDINTGKTCWKTEYKPKRKQKNAPAAWNHAPGWSTATLVAHDNILFWANGKEFKTLSTKDGAELWQCATAPGFKSGTDIFVADNLVWIGPDYNLGRNLRTGKVNRTLVALEDLRTKGHHHRCYREKATANYIIGGYRGMEFYDLDGGDHSRNNWVRGNCQYGILPCNGLLYAPSHACGCYMEAKLFGFWALAPESNSKPKPAPANRLTKGPAWGTVIAKTADLTDQWPTHRHNPLRTASTTSSVPTNPTKKWQTKLGKRITPPVIANNTLLTSIIDTHQVVALSANDGAELWTFTAGAPVDSPPTIHNNTALFGSADGYVYCLRLTDGRLVWRFQASPRDLRTVSMDHVESVWPVHGSVLVIDGIVYFTAGRSSYIDGGITMYALDAATGKLLNQTDISSTHPIADKGTDGPAEMTKKLTQNATDSKTFLAPDLSDAFSMRGGVTSDILVSDGQSLYLRTLRFDKKCNRLDTNARHLYSTTRLLDGNENHRSHMLLGTGDFTRIPVAYSWIANRPGAYKSNVSVPYGLFLAFDDKNVWGIRRTKGYTLYRDATPPELAKYDDKPDIRYTNIKYESAWNWSATIDIRPRALVRAADKLIIAGAPNLSDKDPKQQDYENFEGKNKGLLQIISAQDGTLKNTITLDAPPVWDGIAITQNKIYLATTTGQIQCLAASAGK